MRLEEIASQFDKVVGDEIIKSFTVVRRRHGRPVEDRSRYNASIIAACDTDWKTVKELNRCAGLVSLQPSNISRQCCKLYKTGALDRRERLCAHGHHGRTEYEYLAIPAALLP